MEITRNATVNELLQKYAYLCEIAVFFSLAVGARALFQGVPSVDPLLPIIMFVGARHGARHGAWFGATAYAVSNSLVWGGQGWWTIPMALGAATVGFLGGAIKNNYAAITFGTIAYETVMNLSWAAFFGLPSIVFAIPFGVVHLVSNLGFVAAGKKVLKL
jgi:hypothetical protein